MTEAQGAQLLAMAEVAVVALELLAGFSAASFFYRVTRGR